jgi:methylase of polypeptide subunit release factors
MDILKLLLGGGKYETEHDKFMQHFKRLRGGGKLEDALEEIAKLKAIIQQQANDISELKQKRTTRRGFQAISQTNLKKEFKTGWYKENLLIHPELYNYHFNQDESSFDKINSGKVKNVSYKKKDDGTMEKSISTLSFRNYQKEFIESWSVSSQEAVILYYGVGSGKTLIATNCAEQFTELNPKHHVYFLTPASLVLGMMEGMFKAGIDPTRQYEDGSYVYYFISYQQMIRSDMNFKPDSLLIVDEVHNLRNFFTKGINEKVSARKWVETGDYSLLGNSLARKLMLSENKFLRTIFMTGTLFVNSPADLEAIIALGYKKRPLLNFNADSWERLQSPAYEDEFKIYYQGLVSFYRIPSTSKEFPKKNFHFIPIVAEPEEGETEQDNFFVDSRNAFNGAKNEWVLDFLKEHKGERTLIYTQFVNRGIMPLLEQLDDLKIKYRVISGKESQAKKKENENDYNTGKVDILVFSLAIKEGVSFKETDNIIVTQPYWNYAIMEQILARGLRLDSHKKGDKSTVNCYMLVGVPEGTEEQLGNAQVIAPDGTKKGTLGQMFRQWFKDADKIMNNDIKTLVYPYEKVPKGQASDKKPAHWSGGAEENENKTVELEDKKAKKTLSFGCRDIHMYNIMFNKQEEINLYEKRILSLPSFENVNNVENNEFIKEFNATLIDTNANLDPPLNRKEELKLKRDMYKKFYQKEIDKINKRLIRFEGDSNFKENRNPDLEQIIENRPQADIVDKVEKLIKDGASLDKIFSAFDISKTEITSFQANFTPENEVMDLIDKSGIKNDTRPNLKVLEPTAGIGNVIGGLLKQENAFNYMIDGVEIHNVFFQIAKAQYGGIDNVSLLNVDFLKLQNKYNYDYIIGNPPFNLRSYVDVKTEGNRKLGKTAKFEKRDKTYFDVDFVAHAYNLLVDGGKLAMIISNRHRRQPDIQPFKKFNQYLELLGEGNVQVYQSSQFKADKGVTKAMETNFGMEIIVLTKMPNRLMELDGQQLLTEGEIQQGIKAKKRTGEEQVVELNEEDLTNQLTELKGTIAKQQKEFKPTVKELREQVKKLGIPLSKVVNGKRKPKNRAELENDTFNPTEAKAQALKDKELMTKKTAPKPKKEKVVKVKAKTLKELKAEAKAKKIILSKTVNGKKVQKTKADLLLELSPPAPAPKGIVAKAVQKIEKKIEKVAPTPAPKKETKAQTKKRLETEKITKKLQEENKKVLNELDDYVKNLSKENKNKYSKLADKAKEKGIPLTTFNNKNKIVYKTIADLEQDLKDNDFLLDDKPVEDMASQITKVNPNAKPPEIPLKRRDRTGTIVEAPKPAPKPVEAPKPAPKKEEKKLDDTQGKLLQDKLNNLGDNLIKQIAVFKKSATEVNKYVDILNAEVKKTKQKTGRSEVMKLNKMKKETDAENSKMNDIQSNLKEIIEKIYPYTKYDDYEEVKKKAEPIRKRIIDIKSELSSINFSQNITTFSSSNKKSYEEQLADEKIRKAKEKEANKVKTEPLEKELNKLENDPDYEKLLKYELTTYNPEFRKFVKEITDRLNDGKPIDDLIKTKPQLVGSGNDFHEIGSFLKKYKNLKGGADGWDLHAVIVHKPYELEKARQEANKIMKTNKNKFMRETKDSYRFRNISKQKFNQFRTQVVNPNISMIWGKLKGGGAEPPEIDFFNASKSAYGNHPISGYTITDQIPTITIYKKNDENTIIISVRGSYDTRDWLDANSRLAFNRLDQSDRYKEDKEFVGRILQKYGNTMDYYIASHSLGGAIATELQRTYPQLKSGYAYNPAFQTKELLETNTPTIRRKYTDSDALGKVGQFLKGSTVEKTKESTISRLMPKFFKFLYGHQFQAFNR